MKKHKKRPPLKRGKRKPRKPRPFRKRPIVKEMTEKPEEVMIAEARSGEKSVKERREFVTRLLVRRRKRGFIVGVVREIYKVSIPTVDEDIRKAKDEFIRWYDGQKVKELKAESEATMDEVVAQGFLKGDLSSVVQAQKHKDTVTRLVKDDETPAATLGVVVLQPKQKDMDSWSKKFGKPNKRK